MQASETERNILIIGASVVNSAMDEMEEQIAAQHLPFRLIDAAVSGATSADAREHYSRAAEAMQQDGIQPDLVIISLGGNDILNAALPMLLRWARGDETQNMSKHIGAVNQQFQQNMSHLIEQIRADYPRADIRLIPLDEGSFLPLASYFHDLLQHVGYENPKAFARELGRYTGTIYQSLAEQHEVRLLPQLYDGFTLSEAVDTPTPQITSYHALTVTLLPEVYEILKENTKLSADRLNADILPRIVTAARTIDLFGGLAVPVLQRQMPLPEDAQAALRTMISETRDIGGLRALPAQVNLVALTDPSDDFTADAIHPSEQGQETLATRLLRDVIHSFRQVEALSDEPLVPPHTPADGLLERPSNQIQHR